MPTRPRYFMREALNEHSLMDVYHARPPYQQNDYIRWITRAKLETTRRKRLGQMLSELKGGNLYMNMKWSGKKGFV
jgi:uncharacterized protein YdeI (YjbR/CyaY-like superfamily)